MNSANPIGFAVLGYGRIGKRHAALIEKHPEARLIALADLQKPKDERGTPFFPGVEALLDSPQARDIDVVIIATPSGLHADHACACLNAGKNVVVEKPIALHKADADRILETAVRNKKKVFPVLQNRLAPGATWLKQMVTENHLGDLNLVQVDCFWNRDDRYYLPGSWHGTRDMDGGVLFTQFSHFVDLLYWLYGDVTDIRSLIHQGKPGSVLPDSGTVQFRFTKKGIGCFTFSTAVWDKNMDSAISVIAEKGAVRIRGQYLDHLDYCHVEGRVPTFPPDKGDNHAHVLNEVIDVLKGRSGMSVSPEDAAAVVGIIERMYALQ